MAIPQSISNEIHGFVPFANVLADVAKVISCKYFRQKFDVELKVDASPVTIADREVEAAMRELILAKFPDHGIYGEEYGASGSSNKYVWVIDPIDGTKSFISGVPLFGTLIALLENGSPVLGVIDMPILGERWIGGRGMPTLFNGNPVITSSCSRLHDAVAFSTSPHMFKGKEEKVASALTAAVRLRRYGGDCYMFGLLSSGFVDVVLEAGLKPYDFLALAPIVEGAGGKITDWDGNPLVLSSDGKVLATANKDIHQETIQLIKGNLSG